MSKETYHWERPEDFHRSPLIYLLLPWLLLVIAGAYLLLQVVRSAWGGG
jgi:hypothetical protein